MNFAQARRAMVDSQLRPQAVTDPLVVAAMASVPREAFVPEGAAAIAYIDRMVPLGNGRSLSPAASLGRMLTELQCVKGEHVRVDVDERVFGFRRLGGFHHQHRLGVVLFDGGGRDRRRRDWRLLLLLRLLSRKENGD